MQMNNPIGMTPLDNQPNGIVGKPLDRVDGRLKVTGGAVYAYEVEPGTADRLWLCGAGIDRQRAYPLDR